MWTLQSKRQRAARARRILLRLVSSLLVAQSLLACDAITEFFVGSWDPDDPHATPYIAIVPTGSATVSETGATTISHAEIVVGGVSGARYVALFGKGTLIEPLGRDVGCVPLPDRGSLPIAFSPALSDGAELWPGLVTADDLRPNGPDATDGLMDGNGVDDDSGVSTSVNDTPCDGSRLRACVVQEHLRDLCGASRLRAVTHLRASPTGVADPTEQDVEDAGDEMADASDDVADASDDASSDVLESAVDT